MRKYPQFREEVEKEMKFSNVPQSEAEDRIARKNNLQHKTMSRTEQGRWIKMLKKDKTEKMAGAVMSSTAGLQSKPRYSKKKKEVDEE